jgi:hypothetical protein
MAEKMAPWALEAAGRIVEEHVGEEERGLDLETIKAAIAVALTSAYEDGMKTGNEVGSGEPVS